MIESITVITIAILLLAYFRPGKTPPLENPLTVERSGKYKIMLASRLNLAQPFIEAVAELMRPLIVGINGSAVQYFVVRDNQVKAHGSEIYLLAICCRNQMLYFYGANPKPNDQNEYLDAIKAYSIDCMKDFPSDSDMNREILEEIIVSSTASVANERRIDVSQLSQ
jgi:hypothetical protein